MTKEGLLDFCINDEPLRLSKKSFNALTEDEWPRYVSHECHWYRKCDKDNVPEACELEQKR